MNLSIDSNPQVSFDEATIAVKERAGEKSGLLKRQLHGSRGLEHPLRLSGTTQESHMSGKSSGGEFAPGTGTKPDVGSDFFTSRGSDASSAPTFTNLPVSISPVCDTHTHTHTHTHTRMHAHSLTHTHSLTRLCMNTHNCIHTKTQTHVHTPTLTCAQTHVHAHMCPHKLHAHKHTHSLSLCLCLSICHVCTHACKHTCTQVRAF